jgi:hypothetical protein
VAMANERVTLLRYAKIPDLGWRRGKAIIGKTGKVTPDYMVLGKSKDQRKVYAPEGHYELRYYEGRLPRYKKVGNDPTEALDALERAQSELKLKNSAKAIGYIIPSPAPVNRKSLADYGRDFLELKRSPSLTLDDDTITLYTNIVDEFVPLSAKFGKKHPEDITEQDVIRYCDELDKRYSDGVRARRYTSLRGFLFYCGLGNPIQRPRLSERKTPPARRFLTRGISANNHLDPARGYPREHSASSSATRTDLLPPVKLTGLLLS